MLEVLVKALKTIQLQINTKKTEVLVVDRKKGGVITNVRIESLILEQVNLFCYIGSVITSDSESLTEVKRRISLSKKVFQDKKNLLINTLISKQGKSLPKHLYGVC